MARQLCGTSVSSRGLKNWRNPSYLYMQRNVISPVEACIKKREVAQLYLLTVLSIPL